MKTTLVIIIMISALFAVNRSIKMWNEFTDRPLWEKLVAVVIAFVMGALLWPILLVMWVWNWLKNKYLLKEILGGIVIMIIGAIIIYFGCLFS